MSGAWLNLRAGSGGRGGEGGRSRLETRMVEQAERLGGQLAAMLRRVTNDPGLALTARQRVAVGPALRAALALVRAGAGR
jgi:hypothetical protein